MKNLTLLTLCREELSFLVREYSCRVHCRRFGFVTPAIIFKQRAFALEVHYDELEHTIFLRIAPVRFGVTIVWKWIDVEAIFSVNCSRNVDRGTIDGMQNEEYYRRVLRSFSELLQDCATDFLNGDFSRLRETQEWLSGQAELRRREFADQMRRDLDSRKRRR